MKPSHVLASLLATASVLIAHVAHASQPGKPAPAGKSPPAPAAATPGLEVRFCPADRLYPWPLADSRQLNGLLLQNVAIVNRGVVPAELESVSIELLSKGAVVDARHFDGAALARFGAGGAALQKGGMLELVAFQFCGTSLIGADVELAGATLAPAQAVLIGHQAFAYPGTRDALRVRARVRGADAQRSVEGVLPIASVQPALTLAFPLRGAWYVAAGASFHTGHRWAIPEEFALDLVQLGADGRTYSGDGTKFEQFHAYGAEVLAVAAGKVVGVLDGQAEDPATLRQPGESGEAFFARVLEGQAARLMKGLGAVLGNHVTVQHPDGTYSHYVHLKPGSVRVRPGDAVTAGQVLGLLGSSGNSTEPHLHFQVCDRADALACAGRPVAFSNVAPLLADEPRQLQSGDIVIAR